MDSFPGSPRLLKSGLVLLDPDNGSVQRVIALQYNPDTLSRTLQAQTVGEGADRSQVLRLKGPPVETIKVEAEIDATDQLEFPEQNKTAVQEGIRPQLAALETILYPDSARLQANDALSAAGTLEIIPMPGPLVLFVWSRNCVVPVMLKDFGVVEEAFDANLNPIRAKVTLGLRVLSVNDLDFGSRGGSIFMVYQQQKERLRRLAPPTTLNTLGIGGLP